MESKICQYAKCGKEFTTESKKKKYCSTNCRIYDFAKNKQVKKLVLIEDTINPERSGNYWLTEDGRKCKLVWVDEEIKIPDETYPITVTPLRLKIKTVKDQEVPEKFETYPASFQELLTMAKIGVQDVAEFKAHISASKLAPNQKSMILSKLTK